MTSMLEKYISRIPNLYPRIQTLLSICMRIDGYSQYPTNGWLKNKFESHWNGNTRGRNRVSSMEMQSNILTYCKRQKQM